ncbi:MAG: hypothetical protein IT355_15255 [Gemmatimonadaceae bacterium]|nr:hypothetical protein [Gemmatimonadaceae bacterium]
MNQSLSPAQLLRQAGDLRLPRRCRLASRLLADAILAWPEPSATLGEFAEHVHARTGECVTRDTVQALAGRSDRRNDPWTGEALDALTRIFRLVPGCASLRDLDDVPAARWRFTTRDGGSLPGR